jgi:hypothetical protein
MITPAAIESRASRRGLVELHYRLALETGVSGYNKLLEKWVVINGFERNN